MLYHEKRPSRICWTWCKLSSKKKKKKRRSNFSLKNLKSAQVVSGNFECQKSRWVRARWLPKKESQRGPVRHFKPNKWILSSSLCVSSVLSQSCPSWAEQKRRESAAASVAVGRTLLGLSSSSSRSSNGGSERLSRLLPAPNVMFLLLQIPFICSGLQIKESLD